MNTPKTAKTTTAKTEVANEKLTAKCTKILSMLRGVEVNGGKARYAIGLEVQDAMDDVAGYGKSAVEAIAKTIKCTAANLYDYARVTRAWSAKDFDTLCKEKSPSGGYLTFSHFIVLANVDDPEQRAALAKDCLAHGYSVRDLKAKVSAAQPEKKTKPAASLSAAKAAARLSAVVGGCASKLQSTDDLISALKDASADEKKQARAAYAEICKVVEKMGADLAAIEEGQGSPVHVATAPDERHAAE